MKKIMAAFYLLAVVTALMLVDTRSTNAKETKLDLEERVRTLEIQAEISGHHIRALESDVYDLKASPEARRSDASVSDLKASVSDLRASVSDLEATKSWVDTIIHSNVLILQKFDKRVSNLEEANVCTKPTAKERADSAQVARLKSRAAWCLRLRARPE